MLQTAKDCKHRDDANKKQTHKCEKTYGRNVATKWK